MSRGQRSSAARESTYPFIATDGHGDVWNCVESSSACVRVCVRAAPIEGASVSLMNLQALRQDKVPAILCVEPTRGAGGQEGFVRFPDYAHICASMCISGILCGQRG